MSCKDDGTGKCDDNVEASSKGCADFSLTTAAQSSGETCLFSDYVEENLALGGAEVNVFKLQGVHEQGELIDLTGSGTPISSGNTLAFPVNNAFNIFDIEWRSTQIGLEVVSKSYIGYDFGEIKLDNGRVQYGVETSIRHNIATIKIKQGENQVTKARIERSVDGIKWYGVAIVNFPADENLNEINFNHSVPSRYWRIRPIVFNGSGDCSYWSVKALELHDFDVTSIDDIQDEIFQENRDRDYSTTAIMMKMSYDLQDTQSDLTAFGIELPSETFYFQVSFASCVRLLGRPIVIGDIFEVPSEAQYSFNLTKIKKFVEVTDVSWAVGGYTPGWVPTMLRVMAQPMMASQETMDLFDNIADDPDQMGLSKYGLTDIDPTYEHNGPEFQDNEISTQSIEAESLNLTPERGVDIAKINIFSDEEISTSTSQGGGNLGKLNVQENSLYVEDAMPPNGIDFTIGDTLPDITSAKNEEYHRLTYDNIDKDIPTRLYKFSSAKNRWIYMETDRRAEYNHVKPRMSEYYKLKNTPTDIDKI